MPFALLVIGLVMTVAAVRKHEGDLYILVKGDFTGPDNFVYWVIAIMVVGAIGYIPRMKPFSHGFLALIIISLLLHRQGFFAQFQQQIGATAAHTVLEGAPVVLPAPAGAGATTTTGGGLKPLAALEPLTGVEGV